MNCDSTRKRWVKEGTAVLAKPFFQPAHTNLARRNPLLYEDEFIAFASASHPLATRKKVALADLAQWRWASTAPNVLAWQWLQRTFENHGLPSPRIALEAASPSLRTLVSASSELLCFNARRAFRESARHLPMVELPVKELKWIRHVGTSYRKDAYLSPAAKRFIEILKATAKDIAKDP